MAASPKWKVYAGGEYRASCKYVEDAAVLVSVLGEGSEIREGHSRSKAWWMEGKESQPAEESYDFVAMVVYGRSKANAFELSK